MKLLIILALMTGCSLNQKGVKILTPQKQVYNFEDGSGSFKLIRESGIKNKLLIVKRKLLSSETSLEPFEKSIAISEIGKVHDTVVSRPKQSQYSVWFDKKKYFSSSKIDLKGKKIIYKLISPEKQWQGIKEFDLPQGNNYFCYFYQLVECVRMAGFFREQQKNIKLYVIFEGWPYIKEQYPVLSSTPIMMARFRKDNSLNADGKEENGKYALDIGEESIFYFLDKNNRFKKLFWISQGLSIYSK